jgi:hypothetical protein
LRNTVLIFHQAALGDFLVTWPIALAVTRSMPQHRVVYVTAPSRGGLAAHALGVEWRNADQFAGLFVEDASISDASKQILDRTTLSISFVSNGNDVWSRRFRTLAPQAKLICLNPKPPEDWPGHITDWHIGQLAGEQMLHLATASMLRVLQSRGLFVAKKSPAPVLVHPGAGSPVKRWPLEKYVDLVHRLNAERSGNAKFVVGSDDFESMSRKQIETLRSAGALLLAKDGIELLDTLRSASAFIGNDSGPGHLAGLCGLPSVILFGGSSRERLWKPIGPRVHVIRHDPLDDLGVDAVVAGLGVVTA